MKKQVKSVRRVKTETAIVTQSGKLKRKKEKALIIDILGTEYTLRVPVDTTEMDNKTADGLCDDTGKDIQIRDLRDNPEYTKKNAIAEMKHNIRHELLHAIMKECGLGANNSSEAAWPVDEACIDFFATQHEKICAIYDQGYQIFKELD